DTAVVRNAGLRRAAGARQRDDAPAPGESGELGDVHADVIAGLPGAAAVLARGCGGSGTRNASESPKLGAYATGSRVKSCWTVAINDTTGSRYSIPALTIQLYLPPSTSRS